MDILYEFFQLESGMRSDSQKILILITDGKSEDDVSLPSQRLRDDGIEIYTIGDWLSLCNSETTLFYHERITWH